MSAKQNSSLRTRKTKLIKIDENKDLSLWGVCRVLLVIYLSAHPWFNLIEIDARAKRALKYNIELFLNWR